MIKNYILRYIRKRKYGYKHVPRQLSVALTNKCNARCFYCAINEKTRNADMTFDQYKMLLDAMPFIDEVQPQIVGEPTLHPDLVKMVKYAKDLGKSVVIYTNGSIFTTDLATKLFNIGLDKLIFSIDDNHKEGFEASRVGLSWNRVFANVYNYRKIRDAEKAKTKLYVRACITDKNRNRIKDIGKFWLKYVDSFAAMPEVDVFAGKSRNVFRFMKGYECPLLEDSISIDADGKLLLCCRDWFGELEDFGKIDFSESLTPKQILDLYNSPLMNLMRERLKNGVYVPELCRSCLINIREWGFA